MIKRASVASLSLVLLALPAALLAADTDKSASLPSHPDATQTTWVLDESRAEVLAEDAATVCVLFGKYTDEDIAKVIQWERVRGYTRDEYIIMMLICRGHIEGRIWQNDNQ